MLALVNIPNGKAPVELRQVAEGSGPPAGTRIVALMDEFGWAERAAVPTQRIAVLPDTVSFAAAAALPVAGLTALRAFRRARHRGSGTEGTRGGAAGIGCDRRGGRHRASARAVRADPRIRRRRVVGDGVARSGREWRGGG